MLNATKWIPVTQILLLEQFDEHIFAEILYAHGCVTHLVRPERDCKWRVGTARDINTQSTLQSR